MLVVSSVDVSDDLDGKDEDYASNGDSEKFHAYGRHRLMIEEWVSDENGWFNVIEMLIRAERQGMKIAELPVRWTYEEHSKVRIWKVTKNYLGQMVKLKKG